MAELNEDAGTEALIRSKGEGALQVGLGGLAILVRDLSAGSGKGGWRDVMGVEGDADARLARQAFAATIVLVHPDNNGRSNESVEATKADDKIVHSLI